MKAQKIMFVGGGTGGHILPLLNLVEGCLMQEKKVAFVLSEGEIDREIVKKNFGNFTKKKILNLKKKVLPQAPKVSLSPSGSSEPSDALIKTYFLRTGKIRRYFSWQNFSDFFRIFGGVFHARKILKKEAPDIIFFKGGFVCFPVLIAAKFFLPRCTAKMYLHESDVSFSNLGKFIGKFCDRVFSNFGENALPLFYGNKNFLEKKYQITHEKEKISDLKKIFIFGGSQGAKFINEIFISNATKICKKYKVILVCGLGKKTNFKHKNFEEFEFLEADEFFQKLAESDLVISRASASVFQILNLKKKSILIPLPSSARNHQEKNARYFEKKGVIKYLKQNENSAQKLFNLIEESFVEAKNWDKKLTHFDLKNKSEEILEIVFSD